MKQLPAIVTLAVTLASMPAAARSRHATFKGTAQNPDATTAPVHLTMRGTYTPTFEAMSGTLLCRPKRRCVMRRATFSVTIDLATYAVSGAFQDKAGRQCQLTGDLLDPNWTGAFDCSASFPPGPATSGTFSLKRVIQPVPMPPPTVGPYGMM
jgi:hypothetical protein